MRKPRNTGLGWAAALLCGLLALVEDAKGRAPESSRSEFRQPAANIFPDLFVWTDTCNVYVLKDGENALLIDLGDGSVLEHLAEIGVKRVEWVLFTHHHREQCQGAPRLKGTGTKMAAPEAERALFEQPVDFRKMNVSLGDAFTIHGSSYVRPPVEPIPLDRTFRTNEVLPGMDASSFAWTRLGTVRAR